METEPVPPAEGGDACDVEVKLKRDLSMWQVLMIGLGPTLGSTIFLLVGPGMEIAGPGLVLVFVLNFVVTLFTAMAYMELTSTFADTGGGYLWVKEGMPQPFGFLAGWMSWFGHCIVTSFYVLGFGLGIFWILESQGIHVANSDLLVKSLSVAVCVVFLVINYRGTKETGKSSIVVAGLLLIIIIAFIIIGFVYLFRTPDNNLGTIFQDPTTHGWTSILIAMGFTFIVFEGYEIISQCGEECKDPLKAVPRASILCIIISTIIFILVAVVAIGASDINYNTATGLYEVAINDVPMDNPENAVAKIANLALPGYGVILIGIGIIIGTLAAINSTLFSSSRVSFAMGRDGALPSAFGKLHDKKNTPHIAIMVSGAIIIIMTVGLPINEIAAVADIMFLLLFFFVNVTAITLRFKRPDMKRHYLMPFFPWVPIVGIITKMVLAIGLYMMFQTAWFLAIAWITVGLGIYYYYGGKKAIETVEPEDVCRKGIIDSLAEKPEDKRYHVLVSVVDEEQKHLVEFAALVARVEDADLNVTSVIELPSGTPLGSLKYKDTAPYIKLVEKMKKVSGTELVRARGTVLISHTASEAIRDTIAEDGVNLLIMGWRGSVRENWILGSTIDRLVHTANCDVILMKTAGLKKEVKKILVI
ncbi:MAG: amino acid permease, partial [Thermoplasmata archaeon]|nr:amino acid permease [Thermoplasmata archaeon]